MRAPELDYGFVIVVQEDFGRLFALGNGQVASAIAQTSVVCPARPFS